MNTDSLKKDFLWYSIGTGVPMILNFIKTPIFTRHYNPTDYGYFALINTTYSYIGLIAFSWILSCVWRYYLRERNNKDLNKFYANIVILIFVGLVITSLVTLVWSIFSNNTLIRKLIIANYINLSTTSILGIYLIIIRLDGKSLFYNLSTIIMSTVGFVILFVLTFVFKNSIDAMLNCNNIVNIIFLIYIVYKFNKNYKISKNDISKKLITELITYGFATVFFNMSLLLLTSGDRYVINLFYSKEEVGVYSQIYGLAQVSIIAIGSIYNNIINPYQFKLFEEDICNENDFYNYILLYIVVMLPFTVYFSMYSRQIANLLLGEKFRSGYKMMPCIMISCFIFGLSATHETRMKFKNKIKYICINVVIASVINIILNLVFIPMWGYELAAITTLVSYVILYAMDIYFDFSVKYDEFITIFKDKAGFAAPIFLLITVQIVVHYILINEFNYCSTIFYSVIEGTIFLSIYVTFTYLRFKGKARKLNNMNLKESESL
jgi:O-antigen/teichoic acid export membrane protein